MAETKTASFDSIMSDLKARKYVPVYYLMGEESYYIDKICDYIAENVLAPEERDFNQTVMFGSDVTAAQVADAARRYPMMAEHQVVIVKEAQNIRQTDQLEKYFKQPMQQTILVFCHKNGTIDGRKKEYVKAIKSAGIIFESKKIREQDLPRFIETYLQKHETSIDPKSSQLIADAIGSDLSRLASELEKLVLSLPPTNRRVTPQVVEDQIGVSKEFNAFELKAAIINRNVYKANQIIKYFDENPKAGSIYAMLPLLFSYFQNLLIAYYAPNRNSQESVAEFLEMRSPWAAKDYVVGMRNYSGEKVLQILSKMREIDAKSKGINNTNTSAGELMKELLFYILH
jgi:DNA polymerase-3 subunit delta